MNKEQTQQLFNLVNEYCESYGIKREDLFNKKPGKAKVKLINNKGATSLVSLSSMRMALGYYIYQNYPLTLTAIAQIVGYSDHSVMSYHYKKIHHYIKTNDYLFMPYYNNLLEIAMKYPAPEKIIRVPQKYYVVLSK